MTPFLENKIKEFKEVLSLDEIKDYLDKNCYLTKNEFGELVDEFIIYNSHDILKTILSSKKFSEHRDCVNAYGEPIVQTMIYAIQAVCSSNEISEIRKINFKESMFSILVDNEINFKWDITDINIDNPLHVILSMIDFFTFDEVMKVVEIAINNGVNPLNRNCLNENAIDVVMSNKYNNEQKQIIISKLSSVIDNYMIEVKSTAYC